MPTREDIAFAAYALKRKLVSQLQTHQVNRQIEVFERMNIYRIMPALMVSNGLISSNDAEAILTEMKLSVFECADCGTQLYVEFDKVGEKLACPVCETGNMQPADLEKVGDEPLEAARPPSPVGREMPPFRVLKPNRAASFGPVYRAENMESRRTVELLLFSRSELTPNRKKLDNALESLEALVGLENPSVAQLISSGNLEEFYYAEFEFCDGASLRNLLEAGKRLEPDAALVICAAALEALQAAEERGIRNWSITPDSLLVSRAGRVKLAPFGMLGEALKQPLPTAPREVDYYRAPELWAGLKGDIRSDLYSLGLAVYEAMTGARAFDSDDLESLAVMIQKLPIPDIRLTLPKIETGIANFINRICAGEAESRFQTPTKALGALRRLWVNGVAHPVPISGLVEEIDAKDAQAVQEKPSETE